MAKVLLCTKGDFDFYVSDSNLGELERVRIQTALEMVDYQLRVEDNVLVRDVIAYGKPYEVTEAQIKKFIPKRNGRDRDMCMCYNPATPDYVFKNHYDVLSSWNCVIEKLGMPEFCIMYRIRSKSFKDREELRIETRKKQIEEERNKDVSTDS